MATRVRQRREELKLPQQDLAALAKVSRQALGAIESGRSVPSVDVAVRLASALGVSVEALFGEEAGWSVPLAGRPPDAAGPRVVAEVKGRWVAHSLEEREHDVAGDGFTLRGSRQIQLARPPAVARENVLLMGCAPVLGLLGDRSNTERRAGRIVWLPRTSKVGLDALVAGETHVAGLHLTDDREREANVAAVKSAAPRMKVTLVTLAHWEVGLVVAKGNPRGIRRASDVARRGTRVVNREQGSSPRKVLERRLQAEGATPPADAATVYGHRDIARVIAAGAADVGPSVRDVAIAFDLGFVAFGEERFDLAVPTDLLEQPAIAEFLDLLTSARARAELARLGYDVRETGRRILVS